METAVLPVYESSHPDRILDPFYSLERFAERVRRYIQAPGFELVIAEDDGDACGLALGYTLPEQTRWWRGLTTSVDPELIAEIGDRTFALCELMVHPDWRSRGIGHAVHDEQLRHRLEERATLLVAENNVPAQGAYAKWGWCKIGKLKPFPDSPHYDALVLPLPGPLPDCTA